MVTADQALPGREAAIPVINPHFVNGNPLQPPFPEGIALAQFAMGCFWGAERKFWQLEGVHATSVGYAAGGIENPTYKQVCSGATGHNEVVRLMFNPKKISYQQLLEVFWQSHNPTQGLGCPSIHDLRYLH